MDQRLEHLMGGLAASPTDRSLEGLDAEVSHGVTRFRAQAAAARALRPVRVVSIGLALAMGVTAGGLTAAASIVAPRGAFAGGADLAPSTLLESAR